MCQRTVGARGISDARWPGNSCSAGRDLPARAPVQAVLARPRVARRLLLPAAMMRSAFALGLCVLSACSYKDPGLSGVDAPPGGSADAAPADARFRDAAPDTSPPADATPLVACSGECQLLASNTSIASAGNTLVLEGNFGSPTIVHFPGAGGDVAATALGTNRVSVVVPSASASGALSVTTGGATVGALSFTVGSGTLSLQSMALTTTPLRFGRFASTEVQAGSSVYVIGGFSNNGGGGYLASVDRAQVNADGSLGTFVLAGTMTTSRASNAALVIGSFLYVIGGDTNGTPHNSIERASINADGSLGAFAVIPNGTLPEGLSGAAVAIIGNSLYVIGGSTGTTTRATVQRASIDSAGNLSAFSAAPSLSAARAGVGALVTKSFLYVVGGVAPDNSVLASVERAAVHGDGTLGPFTTVLDTHLVNARELQQCFVSVGDRAYAIGGGLASVEGASVLADGTLGPFGAAGTLPDARSIPSFALVGASVFSFGGRVGTTDSAQIFRAAVMAP